MKKRTHTVDRRRMSAREIAQAAGISRQRTYVLLKEGHSPEEIIASRRKVPDNMPDSAKDQPRTLAEARRRKEAALALMREIDLAERKGILVNREVMVNAWIDRCIQIRDILLQLPTQLADRLAVETDAGRVRAMIDEEVRRALELLAGSEAVGAAAVERAMEVRP